MLDGFYNHSRGRVIRCDDHVPAAAGRRHALLTLFRLFDPKTDQIDSLPGAELGVLQALCGGPEQPFERHGLLVSRHQCPARPLEPVDQAQVKRFRFPGRLDQLVARQVEVVRYAVCEFLEAERDYRSGGFRILPQPLFSEGIEQFAGRGYLGIPDAARGNV